MSHKPSNQLNERNMKEKIRFFNTTRRVEYEGKEGRKIISKGKREGYEVTLRGSDLIAKFATLISLAGYAAGVAARFRFAPASLAALAPFLRGCDFQGEFQIAKSTKFFWSTANLFVRRPAEIAAPAGIFA